MIDVGINMSATIAPAVPDLSKDSKKIAELTTKGTARTSIIIHRRGRGTEIFSS
jgi:hypothetical protein